MPSFSPGRWSWSTRVRIDEVGPDQTARPKDIVDWMQEAAGTASEAAGYSRARFRRTGAAWFIRELTLRCMRPIPFGANVTVQTWVYDLRRFRTEREYRLSSPEGVAAEAAVEWLFLEDDGRGGVRPRRPDDEMKRAFPRIPDRVFVPDEVLDPAVEAPPGARVAETTREVQPSDLDDNAHANHAAVVGWLDDQARNLFGVGAQLEAMRVRYEAPARLKDRLLLRIAESDGVCVQTIHCGSERLCRAVSRYRSKAREGRG
jgi:acyl-CoA thioesterase FadM